MIRTAGERRRWFRGGMWALALALAGGVGAARGQDPHLFAAIYVRVNGQAVTAPDVVDSMEYVVLRQFPGPIPEDPELLDQIRIDAVREQVVALLVFDEAKALNLEVPRKGAQENIDNFLRASGLRESQLRPAVRRILEADALADLVLMRRGLPASTPPPKRMQEFYEKNRDTLFRDQMFVVVRHIYMSPGMGQDVSSVRKFMEQIRERVNARPTASERAETFAELAKRESQDQFAALGGLLKLSDDPEGYIPQKLPNPDNQGRPLFPDPMVRAIHNFTRADQLSPIVVSERGVHLLYCEKVKGGKILSFREAHAMIYRYLENASRQRNMDAWLRDKHRRSLIFWNDGSPYELTDLIPPPPKEDEDGNATAAR